MSNQRPLILQLDIAGNPKSWINYERAIYYYTKDLVAWTVGDDGYTIFGGKSRITAQRSSIDLASIIAVRGNTSRSNIHKVPTLTNKALFYRDCHICAYCGVKYSRDELTRDHIVPRSRGGQDKWENVVAACGGCNKYKDARTPQEAHMNLLYVPYAPNRSEVLLLLNRNVLADQMEFLKARIPAHSRIHNPPFKQ